ncbi:AraC family transcriptional regulator [Nocardioides sp. YIM 152588]|uniref:AraC family transcriptional regulator n=1 Tax=Nocardioides sp. YIM 152588 TaxID=3158259 RepID=UPI0032E3FD08
MSVIRGTCLLGFRDLVRELGADPDAILRRAGIRPADAGNQDVFLTYRSLSAAMEAAATGTGRPDFGRLLGTRQGLGALGPVGVATRTAATMGEAIGIARTYMAAYSPAVAVALEPTDDPDRTFFEFRIVAGGIGPARQTVELSLAIALEVFRYLGGSGFRALRVHLPHDPLTAPGTYEEYFGCPAAFARRRAGFTLRTGDLSRSVSGDAGAHQVILRYLEGLVASDEPGLAPPVRRVVGQLLPTGAVSAGLVARQFALHPKTFQRRLAEEGTTFAAIVEELRREQAEHYLRDTDLTMAQVARELGYAEQSVLTRSINRWYGVAPSELRRRLRLPG